MAHVVAINCFYESSNVLVACNRIADPILTAASYAATWTYDCPTGLHNGSSCIIQLKAGSRGTVEFSQYYQ